MNWQKFRKIAESDYSKLVPILALAYFMAYLPRLRYPYPIHIDEWVHMAKVNALARAGSVNYPDPFSGQGLNLKLVMSEIGYDLPLAVFQKLSGLSWIDVSRYFPAFIFMITVLFVYLFARKMGFGWEAAFFTCLVPTTVGILGPAFMIPMALGLTFIPLMLWLSFNFRVTWAYLLIVMFIAFLLLMHAPTAILIILLMAPFVLLGLSNDRRHSLLLILALLAPLLLTLPLTFDIIFSELKTLFLPKPLPPYHSYIRVISEYGFLPVISCLVGTFVLAIRGNRERYGLVLGLLALLLVLAVFYAFHYGISLLYLRGLPFAMVMMSIVAGAGLMTLWKLEVPWLDSLKQSKPLVMRIAGILLALVFMAVTLNIAIPERQSTPYYYMIDQTDYQAFTWIRDNIGREYQKAVLDPWKATAFSAISGKYVYTRIHMAPRAVDEATYEFIRSGSSNTTFLRDNGISIIYTRLTVSGRTTEYPSANPDLEEVSKNIYLLKEKETQ